MIGKISMGKSFRGCISYCLEDKKLEQSEQIAFKNRAELIAFNHCNKKRWQQTMKKLTKQRNRYL